MAGEPRTYRTSIGALLWTLAVMVVAGVVLLGRLHSRTDLVGAGLVWTGVGYAVFCGLLLTWGARSATVVTDAGLRVRALFRSRFYPWAEIADLRADEFGGTVIHDRDLRRVELPNVHRKRLKEAYALELRYLTARWESGRGPGWRSREAELARQAASRAQDAERGQKRADVVVWALLAALASFVAVMVLMVTTAGSDVADDPVLELVIWPGFLVVPVVVFLLVFLLGRVLSRAGRRVRGG